MSVSPESLFEALRAVARGDRSLGVWRTVDRFIRTVLPSARDDEARQRTLVAVHRAASSLEATTPAGAAAWVRRVAQRKRIDVAREERKAPLSLVDSTGEPLELAAPAGTAAAIDEAQLDALLAEVEAEIDLLLEARLPAPAARVVPRAQARARLFRAMGFGLPEIAEELALPEPPSEATLSKWVERGRPLLVEALEHWGARAPSRREIAAKLRARVEARRADAGQARPLRRRRASVPSSGSRRRSVRSLVPTPLVLGRLRRGGRPPRSRV